MGRQARCVVGQVCENVQYSHLRPSSNTSPQNQGDESRKRSASNEADDTGRGDNQTANDPSRVLPPPAAPGAVMGFGLIIFRKHRPSDCSQEQKVVGNRKSTGGSPTQSASSQTRCEENNRGTRSSIRPQSQRYRQSRDIHGWCIQQQMRVL